MTEAQYDRLMRLSTTNISDANDFYGINGSTYQINAVWAGSRKIAGEAVTVRLTAAGTTPPKTHLGIAAIEAAKKGNIIVVDNGGRLDVSCWGGVLATGAKQKGIAGVVIDGACRDIDDYVALDFPVYARGSVVATARGRVVEHSTNDVIQFGGVQVRPGDVVMADLSGVVVVPAEMFDKVLEKAEQLYQKEEDMCRDILNGMSSLEVDQKYNYNKMLTGK
ncbi:RraA family protein [Enterocloster lavalensis]|uniref:RraA family protein n=1 Tax=Enterocloster lavalensis TaxID=460384 RepID=UPI0034A4589B